VRQAYSRGRTAMDTTLACALARLREYA